MKPNASWIDKNNDYLGSVTKKLEETKRVYKDEGSVGFPDPFSFEECIILLHAALEFSPPLPEIEERKILKGSVANAASKGVIDPKKLLTEINKLTKRYLDKKPEDYTLVTSMAINNQAKLPPLKVNGVTLQFKSSIPKIFVKELEKFSKELWLTNISFAKAPDDYKYIFAKVSARSQQEAIEQASYTINLVRGIWNLYFNAPASLIGLPLLRTTQQRSYKRKQPVNKIMLGQAYTLYNHQGIVLEQEFWHVTTHNMVGLFENFSKEFVNLQKFYNSTWVKLKRSVYRQELENAIVRYVRALDEMNSNNSFLKLWSLLEHLTDTTKVDNETTAKRVAFVFKKNEYAPQILKVMRDHRNRMVHIDVASSNIEAHLNILKNCVEELIHYHLSPPLKFDSLKEAANFLDLPSNEIDLSKRIKLKTKEMKLAKVAMKYRVSKP